MSYISKIKLPQSTDAYSIKDEEARTSLANKLDKTKQASKTSQMTQAVGVDTNGKLWTLPVSPEFNIHTLPSTTILNQNDELAIYAVAADQQKKVKFNSIIDEVNEMNIDSTPTANSNNLVTSGGVWALFNSIKMTYNSTNQEITFEGLNIILE